MKRFFFIAVMTLLVFPFRLTAQGYQKISADLQEALNQDAEDTLYPIVILMRDQYDAKSMSRQTQYLDKTQKRELMVKELQRISQIGQKSLLNDLQQGQRANIVDKIKSFWIFNGIYCSTTKGMILAIAERPDVAYIMKEGFFHIPDGETDDEPVFEKSNPDDQWNVKQVHAPEVWNLGYTGKGIIVAVIDSGVNYNHTDIANNMWDGGEEFPNHGWDFLNNDNDPMDDSGHGTHCAGTVASQGTNGKQCGIAKDAKIMALKTLGKDGGSKIYTWAAIQFAVSHGADILSLSLGAEGTGGDYEDRIVMENVLNCGVVAAVAAGNAGNNLSTYPVPYNVDSPGNNPSPWQHPSQTLQGGHTATITVGNLDSDDNKNISSSIGPSTWTEGQYIESYYDYPWEENDPIKIGLIKPDISAPGTNIISLKYDTNNEYSTKTGTSMATPCVAGVIALMLEANPSLTPVEIDSIIETTAVACEGQTSKNNRVGSGRIDAWAAINHMLNICAAPTQLSATVSESGFDVHLNWSPVGNVDSYRIYRNRVMIAQNVDGNTYTDANAPAGNNTYFVRSDGGDGHASLPSNEVTVTVTASHTPVNLSVKSIHEDEHTVDFEWNKFGYSNIANGVYDPTKEFSAAQRFPTEKLQPFAGMRITHFYFGVRGANKNCIIRFYEGDDMTTGTLVHEGSYTTTEEFSSIDYILNQPLPINPNKTLWVTVTTSGALYIDFTYKGTGVLGNDALYYRFPNYPFWDNYYQWAWCFQLMMQDGSDYTYKLYRNGENIGENITETTTTASYTEGINKYQISAVTDGYESRRSNCIFVIHGVGNTDEITLNGNDQLYGLPGSCLTASGTLTCTNPDHLILENGAQLINDSEGVKATVKKTISPYTEDLNDGWHLIASPIIDNLDADDDVQGLIKGTFDLYAFDQSGTDAQGNAREWRNYEADAFTTINHKKGYLYANSAETTLSFAGTLAGTAEPTELAYDGNAYFAGFNLIGNPYPCNAYIERSFYVLNYNADSDSTKFVLVDNDTPIAPCAAVLVQAQQEGENVTFSKTAPPTSSKIAVRLNQADQKGATAIDQVRIMFQQQYQLAKYPQENSTSTIYIPQNGKKLAVANAEGLTELPINLRTAKNGSYTLSFETEKLDLNYLHLIDNMTGNDVDLLVTPSYTFEGKTTDYESRFRLVFATNCEDADGGDEYLAYVSNGEIVIAGVGDACNTSLQVVDMTGRVIRCLDVAHNVSTSGMTAGVYVLRLINGDNVKTQKIVIE